MRSFLIGIATAVAALAVTASAPAATSQPVAITITESLRAPVFQTCPDIWIDRNCGTGQLRPFGQATSIVAIGICGDDCNIRSLTVSDGTIVLREIVSDVTCPGACASEWPHGGAFRATLTATVVDGTGAFAGATGTLSGTLRAVAYDAQIKYAGAIALAS